MFFGISFSIGLKSTFTLFNLRELFKINEDGRQTIYLSRVHWPGMTHLTLNGRKIPFVNHVKYLSLIFDTNITWRVHIEPRKVKAVRIFIRLDSQKPCFYVVCVPFTDSFD
jgi:hypothetical protein